jgi:hypothetical protein
VPDLIVGPVRVFIAERRREKQQKKRLALDGVIQRL